MTTDLQIIDEQDLKLYKNQVELMKILNNNPRPEWIKDHPFAKNVKYMEIGRIEMMLDNLFVDWYPEVINIQQLFNSVSVHVRLFIKSPATGKWTHYDGTGAVGIQTDAGKSASDLGAIKQDAVMKALPAAKSFAIKDAAEHIGKVFGRDINRKEEYAYKPILAEDENEKIQQAIREATSTDELDKIAGSMKPDAQRAYASAIRNRAAEIRGAK